jgi:hypothetical protein
MNLYGWMAFSRVMHGFQYQANEQHRGFVEVAPLHLYTHDKAGYEQGIGGWILPTSTLSGALYATRRAMTKEPPPLGGVMG